MKKSVLTDIRDEFERLLPSFLDEAGRTAEASGVPAEFVAAFREFVLRDGRRLRPVLAVFSHQAYARRAWPDIYKVAFALELVHSFALIHDDLVDKTDIRRGGPAMHAMLGRRFLQRTSAETGASLALIGGDFLYTLGIRTLLSVDSSAASKQDALEVLMDAALEAAAGEFEELTLASPPISAIDFQSVLEMYARKTSSYTFCCPLVIGAVMAGAPSSEKVRLGQVGRALGQAYQIYDDLADLYGNGQSEGCPWPDFQERKPTSLMALAVQLASEEEVRMLADLLQEEPVTTDSSCTARDMVIHCGAANAAVAEAEGLLQEAKMLARGLGISPDDMAILLEYVTEQMSTPLPQLR